MRKPCYFFIEFFYLYLVSQIYKLNNQTFKRTYFFLTPLSRLMNLL